MTMTKKDYELVASSMRMFKYDLGNHFGANQRKEREAIYLDACQRLANEFKEANPRGREDKFLETCRVSAD